MTDDQKKSIEEIVGHLGAALSQSTSADDALIIGHIQAAYAEAANLMSDGKSANPVHPIFQPILDAIAPPACTPLEDGRPCGDEGELCEGCGRRAAAEWSWLRQAPKYAVMPPDEDYYAELRDAGRL